MPTSFESGGDPERLNDPIGIANGNTKQLEVRASGGTRILAYSRQRIDVANWLLQAKLRQGCDGLVEGRYS